MGRRTKLTPTVQKLICDNIRLGMAYERAAVCAGVCEATFYLWKKKGEQATRKTVYSEFLEALQVAETEGEQHSLATIRAAAMGGREFTETSTEYVDGVLAKQRTTVKHVLPQWQAAAWILERRNPKHWAKLEKREVTGKDGEEISKVAVGGISPEDI